VLRKHAKSAVWYFHFRGEDGRWKSVTTGHRDKGGAIEWATAFSTELTRREHGIIKADEKVTNDPIISAYDEWLTYIGSQRKAKTLKAYTSVKHNLEAYLKIRPRIRRLDHLTLEEILGLREWLLNTPGPKKKTRTKKTVDNNLVVLRAFLNWCVALRKVRSHPVHEDSPGAEVFFKERRPRIETYTTAEYAAVVTQAPDDLAKVCRALGLTGLRIGELAMLEWSDIDLKNGWLHIRNKTTHDGVAWSPKDNTDRKLPIHPDLRAILTMLRGERNTPGYVFPGPTGPDRSDRFERTGLKRLKGLARVTDVPKDKLTFHNFRRYFISQSADCGIDMACVMNWVGHDDLEMVLYYYRLRDEHAKVAMARYTIGSPPGHDGSEHNLPRTFRGYVGDDNPHRETAEKQA